MVRRGEGAGAGTDGLLVGRHLNWPRARKVHYALHIQAAEQRLAVGGGDVAQVESFHHLPLSVIAEQRRGEYITWQL